MQIIVLLGPPLSGKGEQAKYLSRQGYSVFTASDYLKERAKQGDEAARLIKAAMAAGEMAPDWIVDEGIRKAVEARLAEGAKGLVLDGTPRTLIQAGLLDRLLDEKRLSLKVIELVVPPEVLNGRRLKRIEQKLAAGEEPRADDLNEDVFRHRVTVVYPRETAPLTNYYSDKGVLRQIPGNSGPEEVSRLVQEALNPPAAAPRPPRLGF